MLRWARRAKDRLLVLHVKDLAQDVIEYALLGALIGLLVVAVSGSVARVLNSGANKVGRKFKNHVDHGLHKGWYK